VAWFLASYARDARARIESEELPALAAVRSALEEALGIKFEGKRGDHFFRSTLVQTLFYGVFSAWVLWSKQHPPTDRNVRFDWYSSARYLRVPILRKMFHELAEPGQMDAMRLSEVLDWAGAALNRVDRAAFFGAFREAHAVQYFYEPFLEAFDPALRKELGVWYTPPEIVEYMVARVDTILRHELDIEDGLADPRVYVLDPCCGTGAFLVEVLKRIDRTTRERGVDALTGSDLKQAAIERVFGFEILPAPFVVSHLQIGLLLQNLGSELSEQDNERVSIYLTNALTGWEPPKGPKQHLLFKELEDERDAAERVKRETPILVILGNPPYNGYAGVAVAEERGLTDAYKTTNKVAAPQGQGLNDLYVRFFRMAERRIVEKSGHGVVCFISNYSWLDGLSFTGMREHYLDEFDRIWVDSLNGDKYKTGKLTPSGDPDPSVFSTEFNKEGIQVGTAIALLVRKEDGPNPRPVLFRHLWGKDKREQLLATAEQKDDSLYEPLGPQVELGLALMPGTLDEEYFDWPLLPELFPVSFPGVKTSRDDVVVDIDRDRLTERMKKYFDPAISNEEVKRIAPSFMKSTTRFQAEAVRAQLVKRGLLQDRFVRYCYRPFDVRWLYWEPETKLLDEKRQEYFPNVFAGNMWIESRQKQTMEAFDRGYVTSVMADNFGNGLSNFFPLLLSDPQENHHLFNEPNKDGSTVENVSPPTKAYAAALSATGKHVFLHTIALLNCPAYRRENAGALRQDWARIPLPSSKEALQASAELGKEVAALLDSERHVPGITSGRIRLELSRIALVSRTEEGDISIAAGELAVIAGWGHAGKDGATMPGKGRVRERDYTSEEKETIAAGAAERGVGLEQAMRCLGEKTLDVYLNGVAYWRNVPLRVWEHTIGGYQVIKKWLSYRERPLLGRDLTKDEAREVTNMARRIAAILLMEAALDENYRATKNSAFDWQSLGKDAGTP
jgi:hypothetical protein